MSWLAALLASRSTMFTLISKSRKSTPKIVLFLNKFHGEKLIPSRLTVRQSLVFIGLVFNGLISNQALAADSPKNVNALVYSSSAAEIFWIPTSHHLVEVKRNGESLGILDAKSLYQPNLDSNQSYRYELRTVDADGSRSEPIIISVTTRDFSPPIKRIWPASITNADIAPPPPQKTERDDNDQVQSDKNENVAQADDQNRQSEARSSNTNSNSSNDITQGSDNCIARDSQQLVACVQNANAYNRIDIANNISCGSNCCPSGQALLRIAGTQNLRIDGHGNTLFRNSGQRQCSLLDINNSRDITIANLYLDDNLDVSGCQVGNNCPRMVHVRNSSNIEFDNSHISHGKGYVVYVQGTNGFRFQNSSLHNSGVLGMYIGHGNDTSTNVRIQNSTFTDNQTNALALLGVKGSSRTSNIIENNVFLRNHRKGQWQVAPKFGSGFTGGGQVYIADASNVTVRNNIVKDGYCSNCFVQRRNR